MTSVVIETEVLQACVQLVYCPNAQVGFAIFLKVSTKIGLPGGCLGLL
jgi:hypothetical protein